MIPSNKGLKLPAEPLTPDEVKLLINACSKRAVTGIRNRALIVVLYRAGLRVSEALALQRKDLDQAASTIRVLHGKGEKPVSSAWMPALGPSCSCGWIGEPPAASTVARRCSARCKAAG